MEKRTPDSSAPSRSPAENQLIDIALDKARKALGPSASPDAVAALAQEHIVALRVASERTTIPPPPSSQE